MDGEQLNLKRRATDGDCGGRCNSITWRNVARTRDNTYDKGGDHAK